MSPTGLAMWLNFAAVAHAGTDRRAERRTDTVPVHKLHSMRAVPISKHVAAMHAV